MGNFKETKHQQPEYSPRELREKTQRYIESLLLDNRSPEANTLRAMWNTTRDNKRLVARQTCSDARVLGLNDKETATMRVIAAGGDSTYFTPLLQDESVHMIMNMTHFDGGTVREGSIPNGCGGLHAKHDQNIAILHADKPIEFDPEDLDGYIHELIAHPDVLVQSLHTATRMSKIAPEKSVLAAVQDHRTGLLLPIAQMRHGGSELITAIPLDTIMTSWNDPRKIYKDGIPFLDRRRLNGDWQEYLANYDKDLATLREEFPNLSELNRVQAPPVVMISSDRRPTGSKFPVKNRKPNEIFKIRLPNQYDGKNHATVLPQGIIMAGANARYPIEHFPIEHVIVETGSMDESRKIARHLRERQYMHAWRPNPERHIVIAATQHGIVQDVAFLQ